MSRAALPYYKAYPRDFIEGTIGLSLEVKGAYRLVLDLIYMQSGKLRDDGRYISGLLGCSVRKWESIRAELIVRGKITAKGGFISNSRADFELESINSQRKTNAENGPKAHKNKQVPERTLSQPEPEPDIGIDTNVSIPKRATEKTKPKVDQSEAEAAVEAFAVVAREFGLPVPRGKPTGARLSAIKARLAESGVDGWAEMLAEIRASSFLTNRNHTPRGSPATIDWISNLTNFTKIIEGNYRDRPSSNSNPAPRNGNPGVVQAGAVRNGPATVGLAETGMRLVREMLAEQQSTADMERVSPDHGGFPRLVGLG